MIAIDDERFDALLAEYLEAADQGDTARQAELVGSATHHAARLREFVAEERRLAIQCEAIAGPTLSLEASVLGRFRLIRKLGSGGFGEVWLADDLQLNRQVAIKSPRFSFDRIADQERFVREARIVAQLDHPNIVRIFDFGANDGRPYIVSELISGPSLADCLEPGAGFTARESAEIIRSVADAVEHAHSAGVIHRDIKPSNILMDSNGRPRLGDFGLARRLIGDESMTMTGQVLGTPAYMSPEQARGEGHEADARSDVYALGAVLFQLLTGETPYRGSAAMLVHQVIHDEPPSLRKLNSSTPRDLETIVLKCLQKLPTKRYASASQLSSDLQNWLEGKAISARAIGVIERSWRWVRRHPTVAALLSALAISVTLGFIASASYATRANLQAQRATSESKRAQSNLSIAEDAVTSVLSRIATDERLRDAGLHKLRLALLNDALPYFETFTDQHEASVESLEKQSRAAALVADAYSQMGERDRACDAYQTAIQLQRFAISKGKSEESRSLLGDLLTRAGYCEFKRSGITKASSSLSRESVEILQDTARTFPDSEEHRTRLVKAINGYSLQLTPFDRIASQSLLRDAARLQAITLKGGGSDINQRHLYAQTLSLLANLESVKVALPLTLQAIELHRSLIQESPNKLDFHTGLAESLKTAAELQIKCGELDEAEAFLIEADSTFEQLLALHSDLASLYEAHSWTQASYGECMQFLGRLDDASQYFEKAAHSLQTAFSIEALPGYRTRSSAFMDRAARIRDQSSHARELDDAVADGVLESAELTDLPKAVTDTAAWVVLFEDDFSRGELGNSWKVIDGEWTIQDGLLRGSVDIQADEKWSLAATIVAQCPIPLAVEVSFDIQGAQGIIGELKLNDRQLSNTIIAAMLGRELPALASNQGYAIIAQARRGNYRVLAKRSSTESLVKNQAMRVRVVRSGGFFSIYANEEQMLSVPHSREKLLPELQLHASHGRDGDVIQFDNVVVRVPQDDVR